MNSARHDLACDQGSVFGTMVTFYTDVEETTPLDLTDYTATLRIAAGYKAAESLLTLTVGDGLTIASPTDGTIGIRITPEQAATLPARQTSPLVYSLEIIDGDGVVEEKLYGDFDAKPRVPST